ncbi:hypothetical protein EKD04_006330 [Chloroflexales bacterium ZM16-3]|nr:hypothetical protein [Chloroflexales bacterium ZM16-3]
MPVELSSLSTISGQDDSTVHIEGEIHCALTGRVLHPDEAYWAPPLVTMGDLVTTLWKTATTNPGGLGQVLMSEQPNVAYAPEARQELARRRSAEQLKLLVLLLVIAAALVIPIMMMVMN